MTRSTGRAAAARRAESDPVREMIGLRDTISGLFEDFFHGRPLFASRFWEPSIEGEAWLPPVDIRDAGDEVIVYAGLPGVKKEDCSIEVQDGTLVLSGECRGPAGEEREFLRQELPCGKFHRAFGLATEVRSDAVKASYKDGILEIHLPKVEGAKSRRVEIQ
ncbi:MAG: Hsp20/alpha crystallin family protein [Elusimicrobia bacterium]|nr:Hsp20/alpha crystallin family protein [Elusimicrobiota bacterium]